MAFVFENIEEQEEQQRFVFEEPEQAKPFDLEESITGEPSKEVQLSQVSPNRQGLPEGAGEPISTITGKPVPTTEERFAGAQTAMMLAPYAAASFARGVLPEALERAIMQPVTKALLGHDYVSPISEAQRVSGQYLPEEAQENIGIPSQMAGAIVPISIAVKTANASLGAIGLSAKAMEGSGILGQLTYHVARGGTAGGIYGGISEGTPEAMGKDAALFAVLEGVFGTVAPVVDKISKSNWYRGLAVKERGLVVQSVADMVKGLKAEGLSEAQILRKVKENYGSEEAYKRFAKAQDIKPAGATEPEVPPEMPAKLKPPPDQFLRAKLRKAELAKVKPTVAEAAPKVETGNQVAETIGTELGEEIKYDGVQEGFGNIPASYQFTIQGGIAKGATFNVKSLESEAVKAELNKMIEMRKPAPPPAKPAAREGEAAAKEPHEMTGDEYGKSEWIDKPSTSAFKMLDGEIITGPAHAEIGLTRPETFDPTQAKAGWEIGGKFISLENITGTNSHKSLVKQALSEGKAVPAEVLAEYPDLKPPAPAGEAIEAEGIGEAGAKTVKIYRGVSQQNKKGGRQGAYYTTEKDFAVQFTQTGQAKEVKTATIKQSEIYKSDPLPMAPSEKDFDMALNKAREGGFKAVLFAEGGNEPNSVYVLKPSKPPGKERIKKAPKPAEPKAEKPGLLKPKKKGKGTTLYSGIDPTLLKDTLKEIAGSTLKIIESTKIKPELLQGTKVAIDAMVWHDRNIRNAEFVSKQLEKVVNDIVPDKNRQILMVHAYEHKLKGKYWDQLTEIEKGVVRWSAKEKDKLNKYIEDNDVLEMMEAKDINHIFHHWINPKSGKPYEAMYGKFSKGLPQAKQRTIPTYEAGIKAGMEPATTNLGKLIGLEWESATRANNARQLIKILHGIKGDPETSIVLRKGKPPKPARMVERWDLLKKQGIEEGYVRYDNPFLDKMITFPGPDGKMVMIKGAIGIRKEIYPFAYSYIESPSYGTLSKLNFVTKSLKLGMSMFHVVSLGMQELANIRVPFVHIPKGLWLAKEVGPIMKLLHQEGLELFKGYEDLGYQNKFFEGLTKLGKIGNISTWPIEKMRNFIFNYVQPGMKTSFADMQFRKLLPQYLKKAGSELKAEEVMALYEKGKPIPEAAYKCARNVVLKADGHFSGEHYKRSLLETNRFMVKLYFTPEARKFWQVLLLSPTWQREHLLVAKNVAKSFMPDSMIKKLGLAEMGPIKSQYRRYLLGGIMIIGAVDLWNQMSTKEMDGESKHIWENPPGKGFAVRAWWDEPDYTITDKNGKKRTIKGGPAYIRPLKSLFEVAEWFSDPFVKFSYKLSPVVSAIGEQLFGRKEYAGIKGIPERTLDVMLDVATPIVVSQAARTAKGKKAWQGTVSAFFGMPAGKAKKGAKTKSRQESMLEQERLWKQTNSK